MPASPISKAPSLPSLSSSNIARSHSIRTHDFIAPSSTRAVITAPRAYPHSIPSSQYSSSLVTAWAQDEPPSPTDDDEVDRLGHRSIINTRPSDLASSSRSSIEGHAHENDSRSRWWTFVRPRAGSGKHDWRDIDMIDHIHQLADDRQSQYLVSLRDRESEESPAPGSIAPSPAPFGSARGKSLGRDSPWRGRTRPQDENRGNYPHAGDRQDAESGEKSTLGRSRKNRFRVFILSNIYVPLVRSWPPHRP